MTKTPEFPYLLPDDRVVAVRTFKYGCKTVKKGQHGLVRMTIIVPDGVAYRVRWARCCNTEVLDPTYLRLIRRGAHAPT